MSKVEVHELLKQVSFLEYEYETMLEIDRRLKLLDEIKKEANETALEYSEAYDFLKFVDGKKV